VEHGELRHIFKIVERGLVTVRLHQVVAACGRALGCCKTFNGSL
jgi:hypothetical protein